MERSRKAKPLDAIDAIKTDDVIADTFASEAFLVLLADHRIEPVDLQILLRRVLDLLVRGCQSVHNLRIRELKKDAVGKTARTPCHGRQKFCSAEKLEIRGRKTPLGSIRLPAGVA